MIKEGEDGLLVTPGKAEELAEAIILLLNDRELRQRMGEAGRAKTLANFTWDRVTDRVEKVYHDLLHDSLPTENNAKRNEANQNLYGIKKIETRIVE